MNRLVLGTIALVALAGTDSAYAADMPLKAPPRVLAPSWTGFYVGAGVGFRSSQTDAAVTAVTAGGVDVLSPACAQFAPLGGCVLGSPFNDSAFRFSPYLGFNWQLAPQWLIGLEGDVGVASKTKTLVGTFYPGGFFNIGVAGDTFSIQTTWDASARARLGYLVTPSILVYATGGGAWLHVEATSRCTPVPGILPGFGTCTPPAAPSIPGVVTDSSIRFGWTIGGGIEAALWPNWIARAEYRYADFGTISNTDTRTGGAAIFNPLAVIYDLRVRTHAATFAVAYKFGDPVGLAPPAPVAGLTAVAKAPSAAIASWSGLYVGAAGGLRSTTTDATVAGATVFTPDAVAPFCTAVAAAGGCGTGQPLNGTTFRLSPYLGYSWHLAPQWLVGFEGDLGFADKTTTLAGMYYPHTFFASLGTAADNFSVRAKWDASVRARAGYLITPSVLVYATGGAAWLRVEATSVCSSNPIFGFCAPGAGLSPAVITNADTRTGWTVGGGIEAMLWRSLIARGEYRYGDFGSFSNTNTRVSIVGPEIVTYSVRVRTHTALFGLAYKFDWSGPLIAKY